MIAVELYINCDLRCGHKGLREVLRKQKVTLKEEQVAFFVNNNRTGIKAITWNGTLMYAKFKEGMTLSSLNVFAEAVNGSGEITTLTNSVRKELFASLGLRPVAKTSARTQMRASA